MSSFAATVDKDLPWKPGVKPSGHRLVVYPIPTKKQSSGGIVIPDTLVDREDMAQVEALVLSVGPTCWKDQPGGAWCKEGDTILMAKYSGLVRKGPDGRTYRVINDLDVVGVCDG
jgi:co-chaperonin GroES (HSP10)